LPTRGIAHPRARNPRYGHISRVVAISVFVHLLAAAVICGIAWSIEPLLALAASLPEGGPASGQPVTIELVSGEMPPPAASAPPLNPPIAIPLPETSLPAIPIPTPSFSPPHPAAPNPALVASVILQVPSPIRTPPTIKPGAKPTPKFVAKSATDIGKSQAASPARVGMTGLPAPDYPSEALARKEGGTVGMQVAFGPDGRVTHAEICQSCGYSILDYSTRNFICAHWKNLSFANTTVWVPIVYNPIASN
jgi:TonB family protein